MSENPRARSSNESGTLSEEERVSRWKSENWEEKTIYEEDLPPSSASVEVTTVVPVSGELENGNFWRLLRSFAEQKIDHKKVEMILVVNNTVELSQEGGDRYDDNRRLLFLAQTLQKATRNVADKKMSAQQALSWAVESLNSKDIGLSAAQKDILALAIKNGCRFYAIDASREDRSPTSRYSHNIRGAARQIGGRAAYRRFHENGKSATGLIDFIDADCSFPPNYYEKVLEAGSKNPNKSFFAKEIVTYAPDIPDWAELPPLGRLAHLLHFLRQNVTHRRRKYLVNDKYRHGPAPIVRADRFKKVGGYPTNVSNEDFEFAYSLANIEKPVFVQGTHIRLSDRVSETSVDGATWRYEKVPENARVDVVQFGKIFDPTNLTSLEGGEYRDLAVSLLNHDREYSKHSSYRAMRAKRWKEEVERSKKRVASLHTAVPVIVEKIHSLKPRLETFTKGENFKRWLRKNLGNSLDSKMIDVLADNPIVVASIVTVARIAENKTDEMKKLGIEGTGNTAKDVLNFFIKYLPEYFVELPEPEPNYDLMRKTLEGDGKLPAGYSLGYFSHLIMAQHDFEVENYG